MINEAVYTLTNATAIADKVEQAIRKLGGTIKSVANGETITFEADESQLKQLAKVLQRIDKNGNIYIRNSINKVVYDPKRGSDVNASGFRENVNMVYKNAIYEAEDVGGEFSFSKEERNAVLEAIRNYKTYGEVIYRSADLAEAVNEISNLVEMAGNITLKETDGWFDNVTVKRHGKQLSEAVKIMQKEAQEIMQRQQRLEAAYEDVGQLLGRYYEV